MMGAVAKAIDEWNSLGDSLNGFLRVSPSFHRAQLAEQGRDGIELYTGVKSVLMKI